MAIEIVELPHKKLWFAIVFCERLPEGTLQILIRAVFCRQDMPYFFGDFTFNGNSWWSVVMFMVINGD